MIRLDEVAKKIQSILNGDDPEVIALGLTMPTGFQFVAETEGYHLDSIADMQEGKNFVPVFVSSMGGQYNPIPELKQANYVIPITFYFPVRFKNDMFRLNEYLADVFVGRILTYGSTSGKAVSNISIPQFGEITDLDLKQFASWVTTTYKKQIDVFEPYLSMTISLYLSNSKEGLIYGNDVKVSAKFTYENDTYEVDDVAYDDGSLQSNSQPSSEQEEGSPESTAIPFGTTYGMSIKFYPDTTTEDKNDSSKKLYLELLKIWFAGNIQKVKCEISFKFGDDPNLIFKRNCFVQSMIAPIQKGQLFSITLTLSKITEFDEESE